MLYFDLKNLAAYAGKSKLLKKAGNHLKMTKEKPLEKTYENPNCLCWKMQSTPRSKET